MNLNHFVPQVDLVNKSNRPFEELLKEQKIEAIKFCYGTVHQCTTVIELIDGSKVTGWYYEEWGTTLEEFMKNVNIKIDDELLETYIKWIEKVEEDLKRDTKYIYAMETPQSNLYLKLFSLKLTRGIYSGIVSKKEINDVFF